METAETKELARNAVEYMFDVPLEEIERFYFEPVQPDGVRVVLRLGLRRGGGRDRGGRLKEVAPRRGAVTLPR